MVAETAIAAALVADTVAESAARLLWVTELVLDQETLAVGNAPHIVFVGIVVFVSGDVASDVVVAVVVVVVVADGVVVAVVVVVVVVPVGDVRWNERPLSLSQPRKRKSVALLKTSACMTLSPG